MLEIPENMSSGFIEKKGVAMKPSPVPQLKPEN